MRRRAFALGATLASVGLGASWLGLGAGASDASASGPPALRAGVLGGVEAELLRFVAANNPSLRLSVEVFGSASELRRALMARRLELGSFENAVELETAPENQQRLLVSAGALVSLPLGFYSKKLRRLSDLGPGSRVLLPEEPSEQGRALLVLYHYGLVGFAEELGPSARLKDLRTNPRQLELVPLPGATLPQRLDGDDLVALSYQRAAQVGLAPARNALALEDGFSPFAQVLTIHREARATNAAWLEPLLAAYHSAAVKDFILRRFEDSVRRAW